MKHLYISIFALLLCLNFAFGQDSCKHSFALNFGGFHQTPTSQSETFTSDVFHLAKHIGTTYRLQFTSRQALRFSSDYKNMKTQFNTSEYGNKVNYNEVQTGFGYEFIIKKGKLEPYAGLDFIGVYSKMFDHLVSPNDLNTYTTKTRFGYGGSMLLGLRCNVSEKFAIGIETNVRYLRNSTRTSVESDYYINYIDTIDYDNLLELNPFSAIVIKYSI